MYVIVEKIGGLQIVVFLNSKSCSVKVKAKIDAVFCQLLFLVEVPHTEMCEIKVLRAFFFKAIFHCVLRQCSSRVSLDLHCQIFHCSSSFKNAKDFMVDNSFKFSYIHTNFTSHFAMTSFWLSVSLSIIVKMDFVIYNSLNFLLHKYMYIY